MKVPLLSNPNYSLLYSDYEFGWSVAPAGDVNKDGYADVLIRSAAYAYCYYGSASGINALTPWKVSVDFLYGRQPALNTAGDVNGDGYSDVVIAGRANARIFYGSISGLPDTASWIVQCNTGGMNDMFFGNIVAPAGDVNHDGFDDVMIGSQDTVFVYYGSASGPATSPSWKVPGNYMFSPAGDVNKDSYSDVLITNKLYYGSSTGLQPEPSWTYPAFSGNCVSTAGDVNGDGYSDVVFGGSNKIVGFYGSANGLHSSPDYLVQNLPYTSSLGTVLACAGDVNNDGYSDLIVSDYLYNNRQVTSWGNAFIFYGSPTGLRTFANWKAQGGRTCLCTVNSNFSWSVSSAGDINGDGYSDMMVSEPQYYQNENGPKTGAVYFYQGDSILGAPLFLPVNWVSFKVTGENNDVLLDWQVAGEDNNDHFEIERGRDGISFEKINMMFSDFTKTHYQYTDKNPGVGKWYYRLKQVDNDARFTYSEVRIVDLKKGQLTVSINEDRKTIQIEMPGAVNAGGMLKASLFNINGQRIKQWKETIQQRMQLNYGIIPKGIYILELKTEGTYCRRKLVLL